MAAVESLSNIAPIFHNNNNSNNNNTTMSSGQMEAGTSTTISPSSKASGSTSSKSTTLNKRQHAAHRARMMALSKQLKTRLQYATFKVEHGWSKQSLSEVENLYYRHCKAIGSNSNTNSNRSPSSLRKSSVPNTPKLNSKTSALAPTTSARILSSGQNQESDVFGGLMTPPASGGNFPSHVERDNFQMNPSFTSGLMKRDRSPTAGLEGKGSLSTSKQGKSYADFWSKIGTAGTGQGSGEK